jgi:UDP-glucose 4-epimerase
MQRVIITGADGFVGSYTSDYFTNKGIEVLAIGTSIKPKRILEGKLLKYIQLDINEIDDLPLKIDNYTYDAFIHFAWEGSSGQARRNYELQIKNALNSVKCLKVAKKLGCSKFIGAGSIMEYEIEAIIHKQGTKLDPSYLYGIAKHCAHSLCKSVASEIGIDLIWPMITNAYGIGENSPRFLNNTLRKIINNEQLRFTSATQNYDFIYISDVAKAFYLITQKGVPFKEYIIGSGSSRQLKDYIIDIQKTLAPNSEISFGDVPYNGANLSKEIFSTEIIKNDCGFTSEVTFIEGIKKTYDWLKGVKGL